MQRRILRMLVLMIVPISAVLSPLSAGAEPGVTVAVGTDGVLLDATLARVPVEITCDPMDVDFNMGNAELRQAVSKRLIAHGTGFSEGPFVCDGLPHANSYLFWADQSGPPFAKGDATVSISVSLCDGGFSCQFGTSGVQVIRLGR